MAIGADAPAAVGRARLAAELEEHRRLGRRIVFTNGCFDILHRGHVTYLSRARRWATCWSSASTPTTASAASRDRAGRSTRSKTVSPSSPRCSCVDHLIPFDEDTPHELIRLVRPHVFVKGGDYTRDRLPEAGLVEELGGVVRILPLVEDRSTTGLIERIRASQRAPSVNGHAAP